MKNKIIAQFEKEAFKDVKPLPKFRPGDTVIVDYKIKEGTGERAKFRVQSFEGVCIRYKKGTADGSFTVRKIGANSVGVERVFPIYSPYIENVRVKAQGIVRRSRLFYLRDLQGKAARIRNKFTSGK